jgi:hypothetical protein
MANCDEIIALWSEWSDLPEGELTSATMAAHLRQCPDCQTRWQQWQQEDAFYRQALVVVEPVDLTANIMQHIAAAERQPRAINNLTSTNLTSDLLTNDFLTNKPLINKVLTDNQSTSNPSTVDPAAAANWGSDPDAVPIWRLAAGLAGLGLLVGQILLALSEYTGNVGLTWLTNLKAMLPSPQALMVVANVSEQSLVSIATSWLSIAQTAASYSAGLSVDIGGIWILLVIQILVSRWLMRDLQITGKDSW